MSNKKYLVSLGDRTPEERREIGRKGGIQRGINARKRREEKQRMLIALELFEKKVKKKLSKEEQEILTESGLEVFELIKMITNPIIDDNVRLRAITTVMDRLEGKPTQKIEQSVELQEIPAFVPSRANLAEDE